MDFVVLDFETASSDRNNPCPCEIGLAFVRNSQVVSVKNWFIKPSCYPHIEFVSTHGITALELKNKLDFPAV